MVKRLDSMIVGARHNTAVRVPGTQGVAEPDTRPRVSVHLVVPPYGRSSETPPVADCLAVSTDRYPARLPALAGRMSPTSYQAYRSQTSICVPIDLLRESLNDTSVDDSVR